MIRKLEMSEKINWKGHFQNLTDIGFSTLNAFGEEIDNSVSAGATLIKITIIKLNGKSLLLIYDNSPDGRDKQNLIESSILHNRKDAVEDKQNKFGVGSHLSNTELTQLKGKVIIVSKSKDGILQLDFDYPEIIETNNYNVSVHEASRKYEDMWEKFSLNPNRNGTVKIFELYKSTNEKIQYLLHSHSTDIKQNLISYISISYYKIISSGIEISIENDGSIRKIKPVDPLYWQYREIEKSEEIDILVYIDENTRKHVFVYKIDHETMIHRDFSKSTRGAKEKKFIPSKNHKLIGKIVQKNTFISDDFSKTQQKRSFSENGILFENFEGTAKEWHTENLNGLAILAR